MELATIITAIVSAFVAGVSVFFSIYTYRKTLVYDRKQATLEAYNRLQAEVFDSINVYTPAEIREICAEPKSEEYKIISGYLARIEHFCVGINEGIYDDDTFYALAHGYFDGYILQNRIGPILEAKNQNNNGSKLFYSNTISVLESMKKRGN